MTYIPPITEQRFVLETTAGVGGLGVDSDLVDAILEGAGAFALGEFAPLNRIGDTSGAHWTDGTVTMPEGFKAAYKAYVEGGWGSLDGPEAYGGQGLPFSLAMVVLEDLGTANMAFTLCPMLTVGAIEAIHTHGTDAQRAAYLPKLISGEHVGSLAMSESGAGSDVMSMKLKADAVQGGYILNGTKFWITNAAYADTLVVYANTSAGGRGLTTFLIENDMDGFSIGQKIDKMGMRGSPTGELVFNDCEVPDANVMGPVNGGVGIMMSGLDYERAVLAAIQLGIMQACLDVVLPFVRERKQFGKPIGAFQLMQAKIADMYVALNSARAYVYAVARSCDAGKITRFDAAGAILLASESAVKVANEAIQALGGAGYTKDWPVERFYRDAKLLDIGAGTNEIRRMLIGRELIGAGS